MIPRYLELATYLNNGWSLADELCEDMGITRNYLRRLIQNCRNNDIDIDFEDGKVRLSIRTSPSQIRLAIDSLPPE